MKCPVCKSPNLDKFQCNTHRVFLESCEHCFRNLTDAFTGVALSESRLVQSELELRNQLVTAKADYRALLDLTIAAHNSVGFDDDGRLADVHNIASADLATAEAALSGEHKMHVEAAEAFAKAEADNAKLLRAISKALGELEFTSSPHGILARDILKAALAPKPAPKVKP